MELADKNLAMTLSARGAQHGAGTLAIVNRSIGIDQTSADPADYRVVALSLKGEVAGDSEIGYQFERMELSVVRP